MENLSIFDFDKKPLKIDKPIRLIELFAGIGSQAKALQRIGANFEHYRICEFDKYAIKSYNAIHGTDFAISDITNITASDLDIVDTEKYCYIMTYSFPCQDLSLAGNQKGMAKGSNTRSGLLWEVERLLNECEELPQILLMENVTQVHGKKNKEHFDEWIEFLESKGYSNYWQDLNAKNFGIPQNRNRTFMVSVLGDYIYEFPKEFPLELRLKDMLETEVDEKFYIKGNVATTLTSSMATEPKCEQVGRLWGGKWDKMHDISRRVYSGEGIAPTMHTCGGGNLEPKVVEPKVIGGIGEKKSNGGTQWYQQDRVYDNNIAISVTTAFNPYYAVQENEIIDPFIVASRGRNPENPSDRTTGIPTEQRLEPNFSGCSNTLTTVQKDNYVCEPTINKIDIPQTVRVRKYEVDCAKLCEVLRECKCSSGLNNQDIANHLNIPLTKVEHWFRNDKFFAIPDENIWFELKALLGVKTNEFDESIMTFEEKDGVFEKSNRCYLSNGIAPTITRASADEKVVEPQIIREQPLEKEGWHRHAKEVISTQGLCRTLAAQSNNLVTKIKEPCSFRIRKLTPKECWRLMGFDDADFEKAAKQNSNSQLYKQAGNSIVVDVLCYIFQKMI